MKKRILLDEQGRQILASRKGNAMKRIMIRLIVLLLVMNISQAMAHEEYVFGGSQNELINGMAISADDRILLTGYASSSDGTLENRTKSGRSGWALCVDRQGNVQFSFCSRNGSQDEMQAPVFHEDGTATVLLNSHGKEKKLIELIRLDQSGNVLSRMTLLETSSPDINLIGREFSGGYLLSGANVMTSKTQYDFYDWNGKHISSFEGATGSALSAISEKHALVFHEAGFWLSLLDEQAEETPIAYLYDAPFGYLPPRVYADMISLDDGGAVAGGHVNDQPKQGVLTRWAADGSTIFDVRFEEHSVKRIERTEDGFAILMHPIVPDYSSDTVQNLLYFVSEDGTVTGQVELPKSSDYQAWDLGRLSDETLVVMQNIQNNGETDAMLTMISN